MKYNKCEMNFNYKVLISYIFILINQALLYTIEYS